MLASNLFSDQQKLSVEHSAAEKLETHARAICTRTDRMFAVLMALQWIACIVVAFLVSPRTWIGSESLIHHHVIMAIFGGGLLASLPILLALIRPGHTITRMVVSVCQVLFSSLLIHLSGGRIETHFHIFGSLAFLAAYRDWRVLMPATAIVAADHILRGNLWPESVFGIAALSHWRWIEHAGWVIFEDFFLLISIRKSVFEMRELSMNTAELELAAKVAQASELRFKSSFDQAAVGMCHAHLDGRLFRINELFCTITGYTCDELLELRFQDITHVDDLGSNLMERDRLILGHIDRANFEKRLVHRSGHSVWVQATVSLVRSVDESEVDYMMAVIKDISQVKAAEQELHHINIENRKLSLVASSASDAIIITDSEGISEWANKAFTDLTGYELDELIGRSPGELLVGPDTDPETQQLVRLVLQNKESISVEILSYAKDGHSYWAQLEINPVFDDDGMQTHFIVTQSDITKRIRHTEELVRAKSAAERASRAKSEFLANMSHEIRTPLNGILGFTDVLLRNRYTDQKRNAHLATIQKSGTHLLRLIDDILDLSKIEAGKLEFSIRRSCPHQVLCDVLSLLRVNAQEKNVSLECRWVGSVPETIETDTARLRQMLMNLVGNAIKFTPSGGVELVAYLSNDDGSPQYVVEVRDTGIGISNDNLSKIFSAFDQADNSITRRFGGTGLGLTISQRFARELGGDITAKSQLGEGSVFRVSVATGSLENVRMIDAPLVESFRSLGNRQQSVGNLLANVRVLVCEDGETNRDLIGLVLNEAGAIVEFAENGEEGILAVDQSSRFDVILMDMQMPLLDGYSATQRLRNSGCDIPVIAMTAHAMRGDQEKCLAAGCSAYLSKPIDIDELLKEISNTLNESSDAASFLSSDDQESSPINENRAKIECSLPAESPKLRTIIEDFTTTLPARIEAMHSAIAAGDSTELARISHMLKGTGGTIGFGCFTEPAKTIEELAKLGELAAASDLLCEIRDLHSRIVLPWLSASIEEGVLP